MVRNISIYIVLGQTMMMMMMMYSLELGKMSGGAVIIVVHLTSWDNWHTRQCYRKSY